jgi:hypothetical protein
MGLAGKMTRKRAVTYLLLMGAIVKHLLSNEYGPFDRLLELGVFALIAYEVIVGIRRHRKESKRKSQIAGITATLCEFMEEGRAIREAVPPGGPDAAGKWLDEVGAWSEKVRAFLAGRSAVAAATFLLITSQPVAPRMIWKPQDSTRFIIGGIILETYESHSDRLDNLRAIIKAVDTYF